MGSTSLYAEMVKNNREKLLKLEQEKQTPTGASSGGRGPASNDNLAPSGSSLTDIPIPSEASVAASPHLTKISSINNSHRGQPIPVIELPASPPERPSTSESGSVGAQGTDTFQLSFDLVLMKRLLLPCLCD